MKKYILISLLSLGILSTGHAQYFKATVQKNGNFLEIGIRPNPGGGNIGPLKFDNFDFFLRWPTADAPTFGAPIPNTTDFPALTITPDPFGVEAYGSVPGFRIMEFSSPSSNSTSTNMTYNDGIGYVVFQLPITGGNVNNIQLAGDNANGVPYYLTITKNTSGVGGVSDLTANGPNGNAGFNLFYGGTLSGSNPVYFQQLNLTPIPVRFTGFNVIKKENNAILNWLVENESVLTDRYEVERSVNGVNFTKIVTVAPKALNGGTNSYDLTDFNLSSIKASGVIYYRIKQIDKDGKFVYTEIRSVRLDAKGFGISVYPNPVSSLTNLTLDLEAAADVIIKVTDAAGKEVQRLQLQGNKGINIQRINLSGLAAGSYMLNVSAGAEIKTLPVVKVN